MNLKYRDVGVWLAEARALPKRDLDNLLLFTGAEGAGKSTIAYQVLKALDPSFSLKRVAFSVQDFIRLSASVPRGAAYWGDEMLLNKRKSMTRDNIALLDHLQVCRGLNHHMAICFPHDMLLDEAVLNHRVRWNVHVPVRGIFEIRERTRFFRPGRPHAPPVFGWKKVGRFRFAANRGPEWEAYLLAKEAHMRESARQLGGDEIEEDGGPVSDEEAFVREIVPWRAALDENGGPPRAVRQ